MPTFTEELLRAGSVISFLYPAANYTGIRPRWERRRLRVDRVRLLDDDPLDPITAELEPRLARGSLLVTGLDLDKGRERSFYAESMREVRELAAGEYLDMADHLVELLKAESDPEPIYRGPAEACVAAVREWLKEPFGLAVSVKRIT